MYTWQYDTPTDIDRTITERLQCIPREPDMLVYAIRSLVALGMRAWLKLYHRFQVIGREHLPVKVSYVLVANHVSHLDALCLLSALPLRKLHCVFPVAAADYFFRSLPRTAMAAVVTNGLPFDREANFRRNLNRCRRLLSKPGNILIIFPEGTRSVTGEINSFKPGIGFLVAGLDVPVLPCHLAGSYEALPKGNGIPRPRRIRLRIGAPRHFVSFAPGKRAAMHICRELQQCVFALATRNGKTDQGMDFHARSGRTIPTI